MARTALTVSEIVRSGLTLSASAANADGHSLVNTDKNAALLLYVNNGSGSPITVTIQTPGTVDGLAIADRTVTVAAGAERFIGPLTAKDYNQSDGTVYVDFSAVTTVTVMGLKISKA